MKLLVSAMEPSANKYLATLSEYMNGVELIGIGQPEVVPNSIYNSSDFAIMGFSSILPKIFFFKRAIKEMAMLSQEADGVLLVDAPAFNLRLAKKIKEINPKIKIFYYILPKIWAWGEKRKASIETYTDYQISIFPFEKDYYTNPIYLGNPLVDEYPQTQTDFAKNQHIAFMPGSRKKEITTLLPLFKQIKERLNMPAIVVIPKHFTAEYIKGVYGDLSGFIVENDTKEALQKSQFAFICSGTATLEASLIGIPFLLVYQMSKLDTIIINTIYKKKMQKLRYIGLANIIANFAHESAIHPEFINPQDYEPILKAYHNFDYSAYATSLIKLRELLKNKNLADNQNPQAQSSLQALAHQIQARL